MIKSLNHSNKGFTIVELLIVIVVIAILAAITIVAYNGLQNRAKASEASTGLAQAKKKLELYKVDNGAYPTTGNLASAGVANSDVSFQYTSDGTTYCITGTAGNISYKASDSTSPSAGGCAGHGVGGVAAVTNYALNPSFETSTAVVSVYNGATITRQAAGYADSGSYVARVIKGTAGATLVFMMYPIPWAPNSPISVRFKVRLAPGTTSTNTISPSIQGYQGGSGVGGATGCTIQNPSSLSASSWSDVIIQGCTTPNTTMNNIGVMIQPGQSWLSTDGVEVDSLMIVDKSTVGNFGYGDSTDWVWNGTANASTSTGPAQ